MNRPVNQLESSRKCQIGRWLILSAAILWSLSGLFAKSPVFRDWPIEEGGISIRGSLLAFWRALFACIVLLPLVRRPRWTVKLIPAGLIFAAMNYTFLTSLTKTTAANAIWLQYTAPVWVFLFGFLFLGDRLDRRDLWLFGFGFLGVALILVFELPGQSAVGVLFGLLSGVTYAAVVISLRWLRDEDSAWLIAWNHLMTAVVFFPFVLHLDLWPTSRQLPFLIGFGMLQMGLPYWLFARGVRTVTSQEASGIVLLEPVLAPVWVYFAWRSEPDYQPPAWWTLVGGTFILTGLLIRYLRPSTDRLIDDQNPRSETEDRDGQRREAQDRSKPTE